MILLYPALAQGFAGCSTVQIAGPGAHVAEEGSNPIRLGKYVYAGFAEGTDVGVVASSDWGRTITAPIILSDGGGQDRDVRFAAGGANAYALWAKYEADGVHAFFSASHNHGLSWDTATDLGLKRPSTLMQIAADGNAVHIAYLTNDGNVSIRNSSDGGRTISPLIPIAPAAAEIVIASLGHDVYLAWGINDGRADTVFARSHDGGVTFKQQNLTEARPSGSNEPILSIEPASGRISLVWREDVPLQAIYLQSLDRGETWSAPLIVAEPARQVMVADGGSEIYISFLRPTAVDRHNDFQVYLTSSKDGGKSFAPAVNLSGPTGLRHLDGDFQRPIPWVDATTGAFRLTAVAADGVRVWNGKKGHVYPPVFLGPGMQASPAYNSVVFEGPNATVLYGICH
ncbi:MAG: exo-alpha-sialidase [Alphaproteobacteria bacterium]|nr:exo-alpha-sialidase [Alphaproteobacteria bacterium]